MKHLLAALSVAAVALVAAHLSVAGPKAGGQVASVYDGDTLTLANSQRIRLLQIDTPELGSGECYSRAARSELLSLAPLGSSVGLESDARLDQRDRYGRLLRYVWRKGKNVNVELVRRGAATPYFYGGDRGKYADTLMAAAKLAKANKRGLWKACPGTKLDPYGPVTTTRSGPPTSKPLQAESAIPPIAASASRRTHQTSTATMSPRASASSDQTLTASMVMAMAWGASHERAFRNANARPCAAQVEATAALGKCGDLTDRPTLEPGQPTSPGRAAPTRSTAPRPQIAYLLERGTT